MKPTRTAVCTIISKNYLALARTLMASVKRIHPEWSRYVLLVDDLNGEFDPQAESFELISVHHLDLPRRSEFYYRYTVLELNTAVKPWLVDHLFQHHGVDRVVYLDPDIQMYAPMTEVEAAHDSGSLMVLTPHLTGEIADGKKPSETDILRSGCYNLGFVAVARHPQLPAFLSWWKRKLEFDCRVSLKEGLFVDQKWMDLVTGIFPEVHVLRHPGFNVAYWNLNHRSVQKQGDQYLVNGQPLVFMHYSGLNPLAPDNVSKHQTRYSLKTLEPAARELFESYSQSVVANGYKACRQWPYAFGKLANGTPITDFMRQYYRENREAAALAGNDPFRHDHAYLNRPWASLKQPLVTRYMRFLWEQRPDLQAAFPDIHGAWRLDFVDTFVSIIAAEEKIPEWLVAPARASLQQATVTAMRHDGSQPSLTPLHDPLERATWARSLFRFGARTAATLVPIPRDRETLKSIHNRLRPLLGILPNRLREMMRDELRFMLRNRVALRRRSPLHRLGLQLRQWVEGILRRVRGNPPLNTTTSDTGVAQVFPGEGQTLSLQNNAESRTAAKHLTPRPLGINIVGYFRSEHGVGESARLSARAAENVGVPVSLIDYNTGNQSRVKDVSVVAKLSVDNPYAVNLLHINADQFPDAYRNLGSPFFQGRHTIGYWAWELPTLPDRWLRSLNLVDEIWTPSHFVRSAIAARTSKPVHCIPHAIQFDIPEDVDRSRFRLRKDPFHFLVMFDFLSILERKNPDGAIEAFRRAFAGRTDTALVVKMNNADKAGQQADDFKARFRGERNIVLIDECLSRQEVYQLIACCDAYLSLHRSEGFGLGLAEAMYLGKPVVGTHWSGNTDFMNVDNSCPVDYRIVPLTRSYGPYDAGQSWAEPDLDHAAHLMTKLVTDAAWCQSIAERGQQTIRREFSPESVGYRYRARLRQIGVKVGQSLDRVA